MLKSLRQHSVLISYVLIIMGQGAFFIYLACNRLIARDEGFYLLASKLVATGQVPYLDFFYPQMPLLPYVYGTWMKVFGFEWHSGRMLSAVLSTLLGLLLQDLKLIDKNLHLLQSIDCKPGR